MKVDPVSRSGFLVSTVETDILWAERQVTFIDLVRWSRHPPVARISLSFLRLIARHDDERRTRINLKAVHGEFYWTSGRNSATILTVINVSILAAFYSQIIRKLSSCFTEMEENMLQSDRTVSISTNITSEQFSSESFLLLKKNQFSRKKIVTKFN